MPARPPFHRHTGIVAPLLRSHIDTDQIVPRLFLKRLERSGFGQCLFHDWRFRADGTPDPDFVLNQAAFADATVLVAGPNFGCGSSREHAAWALADFGFRVVIAPSFADIFFANAVTNGILPAVVSSAAATTLADRAAQRAPYRLAINLDTCQVHDEAGSREAFVIDPVARGRLLDGRDEIDRILEHELEIAAYERRASDGLREVQRGSERFAKL